MYFFLTGRWIKLLIFGQVDTEEKVSIFFHECVSFDSDDILEFYLGSFFFLWFQVVRVYFLSDYLGACTCIDFHLQAFVLVHFDKGVASDVQFFQPCEVSGANEVVLVLDEVVRKVELN